MTILGKILVFILLAYSLLVCALLIMVFVARTNWKEAYDAQKRQYDAARASADASNEQMKSSIEMSDGQIRAAQADRERAVKETDGLKKNLVARDIEFKELVKKATIVEASVAKLQTEVQRRGEEVKKMEDFLKTANERNLEIVKEMNKLRDRAVAAEIQNKTLNDNTQRLVAQIEQMQKDLARAKAGGGTTVAGAPPVNPPPDNVEGLITKADPGASGLVQISIGSDAGVQKGHTLEVFRLDPVPSKSLYLGTIRILEVRAKEAVGQPVNRPRAQIREGDRVASRISGS